jgi:uncharacterized protein YceH (UPF0502 family)/SAM-dependent methyltransferase
MEPPAVLELDAVQQRVLGSLLEKERTVPDTYPMTLNGLRTACNQTTGRDPVLDLSDRDVTAALDALRPMGLTRVVHPSHGARQPKYRQVLHEVLGLDDAERAVITLLLLRGAQTPGELRARADRLHPFTDLGEVEAALASLATRVPPLVAELPRRAGQKEQRWIHRLGPVATSDPTDSPPASASPAPTGDPTDTLLRDGAQARDRRVADAYSTGADASADELVDELERKPFDRWLLERLATEADGPAADVGCGPGQVAAHLAMAGAEVTGFDLAPGMVDEARRRFPELRFEVADLRDLPRPDGSGWGLITAWYALVHLATSELAGAVAALAARLHPGGRLAIALHAGPDLRTVDDWFGRGPTLDFALHPREAVVAAFEGAGLAEVEWYLRSPSSPTEAQTERFYIVGRRRQGD